MRRRRFTREFKVEAVKLVRERGVSAAQAGRDLDVHENVLRKWVKEFGSDPVQAFPGQGQLKPAAQGALPAVLGLALLAASFATQNAARAVPSLYAQAATF
jgi:transposase